MISVNTIACQCPTAELGNTFGSQGELPFNISLLLYFIHHIIIWSTTLKHNLWCRACRRFARFCESCQGAQVWPPRSPTTTPNFCDPPPVTCFCFLFWCMLFLLEEDWNKLCYRVQQMCCSRQRYEKGAWWDGIVKEAKDAWKYKEENNCFQKVVCFVEQEKDRWRECSQRMQGMVKIRKHKEMQGNFDENILFWKWVKGIKEGAPDSK